MVCFGARQNLKQQQCLLLEHLQLQNDYIWTWIPQQWKMSVVLFFLMLRCDSFAKQLHTCKISMTLNIFSMTHMNRKNVENHVPLAVFCSVLAGRQITFPHLSWVMHKMKYSLPVYMSSNGSLVHSGGSTVKINKQHLYILINIEMNKTRNRKPSYS